MTQNYRHTSQLGGAYEDQRSTQAHPQMRAERVYAEGGYAPHEAQFYGQTVGDRQQLAVERPRLGAAQWSGAIVSLALVVGLGVWGYSLMMRDVNGVPVIRAMQGAARIVPEDPGGELAMHQGFAVNTVTADGLAADPADRLALAPRDVQLSDEDQPMSQVQPVLTEYTTQTASFHVTPEAPRAVDDVVEKDSLVLENVEDVLARGEDVAAEAFVKPDPNSVATSPRPKARPARLVSSSVKNDGASLDGVAGDILAAVAGGAGSASETAMAKVAVGTRLVQFGAYQSADVARQEWRRLAARFPELMTDKAQVIEKTQSGGKTFYRLRAQGFETASDANRFCAALTSMNAACVPTVKR